MAAELGNKGFGPAPNVDAHRTNYRYRPLEEEPDSPNISPTDDDEADTDDNQQSEIEDTSLADYDNDEADTDDNQQSEIEDTSLADYDNDDSGHCAGLAPGGRYPSTRITILAPSKGRRRYTTLGHSRDRRIMARAIRLGILPQSRFRLQTAYKHLRSAPHIQDYNYQSLQTIRRQALWDMESRAVENIPTMVPE
jgi:hypothetical protein